MTGSGHPLPATTVTFDFNEYWVVNIMSLVKSHHYYLSCNSLVVLDEARYLTSINDMPYLVLQKDEPGRISNNFVISERLLGFIRVNLQSGTRLP